MKITRLTHLTKLPVLPVWVVHLLRKKIVTMQCFIRHHHQHHNQLHLMFLHAIDLACHHHRHHHHHHHQPRPHLMLFHAIDLASRHRRPECRLLGVGLDWGRHLEVIMRMGVMKMRIMMRVTMKMMVMKMECDQVAQPPLAGWGTWLMKMRMMRKRQGCQKWSNANASDSILITCPMFSSWDHHIIIWS